MGIYSNSYMGQPSDYGHDETLDSIMLDESVVPCESDDLVEAGLDYIQTMQENYNSIFMHIGQAELQALEESGQQMVYTEGVLSSIWNAIKRFMMIIDSYTKTDKEFLNKYRNQILSPKNMSDFTFKGYKWHIDENEVSKMITYITGKVDYLVNNAIDLDHIRTAIQHGFAGNGVDKLIENFDDWEEEMRGNILKESLKSSPKTVTEEEFRKELKKYFKGDEEEKQQLDNKDINIHNIVAQLQTSAETKKKVNKVFNENKKSIENSEKMVDKAQREQIKNTPYKGSDKDEETYDITGKYKLFDTDKANYKELIQYLDQNPFILDNAETETRKATKKSWSNDRQQWEDFEYDEEVPGAAPGAVGFNLPNYRNQNTGHFLYLYNKNDPKEKQERDIKKNIQVLKHNQVAFRDFLDKIKGLNSGSGQDQYISTEKTTKGKVFNDKTKRLGLILKMVRFDKQCVITIDSEFLNAMKERSRQNKAICIKIVSYNPKKENTYLESYNEIFSNDISYINRNFISDIRLK